VVGRAAGAVLIEKHFCLSRQDPGLDDPIALDPPLFRQMVQALRSLEAAPEAQWETLVKERYGPGRVAAILGSGRKILAPAEKANYERTNRSLHAVRTLPEGHRLVPGDLAVLRTEKILRPGLPPQWEQTVLGKALRRTVPAGEGLVWDDLLS
jgi:sialic acid synthase SpsE